MQISDEIKKKITAAVIAESARLDGVSPEEMSGSVIGYLEGKPADGKPCPTAEMMEHRGLKVSEEIVRKIAIAVIEESSHLEGVDPEEVVQKVVGALQGATVSPAAPAGVPGGKLSANLGTALDAAIVRKISDAVVKEASRLDGVSPEEAIEKVLGALASQKKDAPAAVKAATVSAVPAPSAHPASMAGTERINPAKTSYRGATLAVKETDPKEVVIGVGPGFQKEIRATICGIPLDDVIREVKAGVEEEGMTPRVVKVLKTSDVCFMGLEAAKISGSGIGIGIQSKGTAVIHQKDLYPLSNLELFPQAPLMTLETYRKIGQNAAKYAKGEQVTPVPCINDPMCRAKFQVKAAIMHIAETEQIDPDYPIIEWSRNA